MSEMIKLHEWLVKHEVKHSMFFEVAKPVHFKDFELLPERVLRYQIVAFDDGDSAEWDCICHYGSWGYEQGLLELWKAGDKSPIGYLTAEEVVEIIYGS